MALVSFQWASDAGIVRKLHLQSHPQRGQIKRRVPRVNGAGNGVDEILHGSCQGKEAVETGEHELAAGPQCEAPGVVLIPPSGRSIARPFRRF